MKLGFNQFDPKDRMMDVGSHLRTLTVIPRHVRLKKLTPTERQLPSKTCENKPEEMKQIEKKETVEAT